MPSRDIRTIEDAQNAIARITEDLDRLNTRNLDFHGRRIINAGASKAGGDYVIRDEINALVEAAFDNVDVARRVTKTIVSTTTQFKDLIPEVPNTYVIGTKSKPWKAMDVNGITLGNNKPIKWCDTALTEINVLNLNENNDIEIGDADIFAATDTKVILTAKSTSDSARLFYEKVNPGSTPLLAPELDFGIDLGSDSSRRFGAIRSGQIFSRSVNAAVSGLISLQSRAAGNFSTLLRPHDSLGTTVNIFFPIDNSGASGKVLQTAAGSSGTNNILEWAEISGMGNPFPDDEALVKDHLDATKLLKFEIGGFTTATTRTITVPNVNDTMAVLGLAQTWGAVQTFQKLQVVADSTHDIGETSVRFRVGYLDRLNAETIQVENSGHTSHWTLTNNAGNQLVIEDISLDNILVLHNDFIKCGAHLKPIGIGTKDIGGPILETWRHIYMTGTLNMESTGQIEIFNTFNVDRDTDNRCKMLLKDASGHIIMELKAAETDFSTSGSLIEVNRDDGSDWMFRLNKADSDQNVSFSLKSHEIGGFNVTFRSGDEDNAGMFNDSNHIINHLILELQERTTQPRAPGSGTSAIFYVKDNKFIIKFLDGATTRYKYLDLTGTGVTWTHTTTAP